MNNCYIVVSDCDGKWISAPNNGGEICGMSETVRELNKLLRERDKALSLFESSKAARKSLSDACDHLQRERDNAITDAKQFEVDCIRALHERNEARAERDELLHALKKALRYVEAYPALSLGASDERRAFLAECDALVSKAEGGQQRTRPEPELTGDHHNENPETKLPTPPTMSNYNHHKQSLRLLNQRLDGLKETVTELYHHSVQLREAAQYWERRCLKLSVVAGAEAVVLGLFIIYVALS